MPAPFSDIVPELYQKHYEHLVESAIAADVIKERGYRTVMGHTDLIKTGFSQAQSKHFPGILLPLHGVDGGIVGYQYRPDSPRTDPARGRTIKYENPAGASVRVDVPPRCRAQLGNPATPLWVTEGVKKVDALASKGCCAIGLTGVWGFKGKNEFGGVTILADFDHIAWRDRTVYLVFDSDSANNPQVDKALQRLSGHLGLKGAKVRVLQLPPGKDGKKIGADDYLSQGGTIEALIGLEKVDTPHQTLRERSHEAYCVDSGCICWNHTTESGVTTAIPLCNFNARVTDEIVRDNGLETATYFKISGTNCRGHQLAPIEVEAAAFAGLGWVVGKWGMGGIIAAGQNSKDRLREAMQLMSQDANSRHIYTHTGWRSIGDKDVYLCQGGAIGADGIDVDLDPQLKRYCLPPPIETDIKEAVKESIDFIYISKDIGVTLPLWASMYLAPLAEAIEPSFTLWYVGPSGAFKSVITALALSHFGDFDHHHLPASWTSTYNQLEKLLFYIKDAPLVIDDWAPGQDSNKARELEVKSEHIIRDQGNRQGKARMSADTSSRPVYIPRGLLITSGEQLPSGHSHTARIYSVHIEPGDIDVDLLSSAQKRRHLYRCAMAHYIKSLQPNWLEKKLQLRQEFEGMRNSLLKDPAMKSIHSRLPDVIALLCLGMNEGLKFAVEAGGVSESDADFLLHEARDRFIQMACAQGRRVEDERPANRFVEGLRSILNMGGAMLRNKDDVEIRDPGPGKAAIGWNDFANGYILLDPGPSYQAVVQHYLRSGDPFTIKKEATWQDLKRLSFIDTPTDNPTTPLWIQGSTRRVLMLKKELLEIAHSEAVEP